MNKENKNRFLNKVNTYYDNNSALFLKLGVDKSHFNIHQPLWSPTVKTQSDAANFSNWQLAEVIRHLNKKSLKIVDLGCGVGASLLYLQQYFKSDEFQFTGLTLSNKQVNIAKKIVNELNSGIQIKQGNFQEAASHFGQVDVVYMIEAFVHSPDYKVLIEQVSQILVPNGLFVVIDDWLNIAAAKPKQKKWINQYTDNWLIGSLITPSELKQTCEKQQMITQQSIDFTSFIKTDLRNKLLRVINLPLKLLPFRSSYINSIIGGIARHYSLKQSWISYQLKVFKKSKF